MTPSPVVAQPGTRGPVAATVIGCLLVVGFCVMVAFNSFSAKSASSLAEAQASSNLTVTTNLALARRGTIHHSAVSLCTFELREHDWFEAIYADQIQYYSHSHDAAQLARLKHFTDRQKTEKGFTFTKCVSDFVAGPVDVAPPSPADTPR